MKRPKPKKVVKKKKKAAKKAKTATCPSCGQTNRPAGEPVYQCVDCGREGFDCCVAGNGVQCFDCEAMEDIYPRLWKTSILKNGN